MLNLKRIVSAHPCYHENFENPLLRSSVQFSYPLIHFACSSVGLERLSVCLTTNKQATHKLPRSICNDLKALQFNDILLKYLESNPLNLKYASYGVFTQKFDKLYDFLANTITHLPYISIHNAYLISIMIIFNCR